MKLTIGRYLSVEHRDPGVKVVRFAQGDLRAQLDALGEIEVCELFQELRDGVLTGMAPGDGLVLNLGGIEYFPSAFLHFLLKVRRSVSDRQGWLVLCHLQNEQREILELTRLLGFFNIASSEEEALRRGRIGLNQQDAGLRVHANG
jgi:anti-anti-sigma factor